MSPAVHTTETCLAVPTKLIMVSRAAFSVIDELHPQWPRTLGKRILCRWVPDPKSAQSCCSWSERPGKWTCYSQENRSSLGVGFHVLIQCTGTVLSHYRPWQYSPKIKTLRASEMAGQGKPLPPRPDDLSSSPRSHNSSTKWSSDFHMCTEACACTHTTIIIIIIFKQIISPQRGGKRTGNKVQCCVVAWPILRKQETWQGSRGHKQMRGKGCVNASEGLNRKVSTAKGTRTQSWRHGMVQEGWRDSYPRVHNNIPSVQANPAQVQQLSATENRHVHRM